MDVSNWLTFIAAYTVISLLPGPSVLMVVAQSISRGLPAGLLCILGDVLGGIVVMALSYLGVGAILAASSQLFLLVKWVGIAYLAFLGLTMIWNAMHLKQIKISNNGSARTKQSFRMGFLTGVLNPKAIVFYMAFLSQFIDPNASQFSQFFILMVSASLVVALVLGGYALLASQASKTFQSLQARRRIGFVSGGLLLGGSVMMASQR